MNKNESQDELIRLRMIRPSLEALPVFELPATYTLRTFHPGDIGHWLRIVDAADLHQPITIEGYWKAFGPDTTALSERQFFLCDAARHPIGTATAWADPNDDEGDWGWIHYVAILPEFQGRGLAKPLLAETCARLKALGHRRAFLNTESVRLAAIRLYLSFGFLPDPRNDFERDAWATVLAQTDNRS